MEQDTKNLIQETVRIVEKHWSEHNQPLLLSTLGSLEGGRISQHAKLKAGGLRPFLEGFFVDRLLVVQHSSNATIVGVVPNDGLTQQIEKWDLLLEKTSAKSSLSRLDPAIWAAFRKPIDNSFERYIRFSDPISFRDVKIDEVPQDGIHVERKYIAGPEAHPEEIFESVMQWRRLNGIDVSEVYYKRTSTERNRLPANDLLGKLILALDSEELQRISIPMDVVAKLRRLSI